MTTKNKTKYIVASLAIMFPCFVFGDAGNAAGNAINNVTTGVGDAVKDVGTGVGDAVTDVGTGVGNAVNGTTNNAAKPADPMAAPAATPAAAPMATPDTIQPAGKMSTDESMNADATAAVKDLVDTKKVAAGTNVNIAVVDGVATVTGTVSNAADVMTIKQAVAGVKGMQIVNVDGVKVDNGQTNPNSY